MGVSQHHDAISGTEKQYVANDYTYQLANGSDILNKQMFEVLSEQANIQIGETLDNVAECRWNLTASECPVIT